jgi:hypothetical protein
MSQYEFYLAYGGPRTFSSILSGFGITSLFSPLNVFEGLTPENGMTSFAFFGGIAVSKMSNYLNRNGPSEPIDEFYPGPWNEVFRFSIADSEWLPAMVSLVGDILDTLSAVESLIFVTSDESHVGVFQSHGVLMADPADGFLFYGFQKSPIRPLSKLEFVIPDMKNLGGILCVDQEFTLTDLGMWPNDLPHQPPVGTMGGISLSPLRSTEGAITEPWKQAWVFHAPPNLHHIMHMLAYGMTASLMRLLPGVKVWYALSDGTSLFHADGSTRYLTFDPRAHDVLNPLSSRLRSKMVPTKLPYFFP